MNKGSILPIIIILAVILSGGAYFYVDKGSDSVKDSTDSSEKDNTDLLAPAPEEKEVKNSNTSSGAPLAGYKTYSNAKVGFEFQYPETWVPISMERSTGLFVAVAENPMLGQKSGGIIAAQFEKMTMADAQARAQALKNESGDDMTYSAPETVTIAGQKAIKQTYTSTEMPKGTGYYFPEKGFVFTITDLKSEGGAKIQQNILASLRFTK